MLKSFVDANVALSRGFDRLVAYPPRSRASLEPISLRHLFRAARRVGDVGGGKKPFAVEFGEEVGDRVYVGMDIDATELAAAPPGVYTRTEVVDILDPPAHLDQTFDFVMCRNTLEHVTDVGRALVGLARMIEPGGRCYIKLPCRKALFAKLNLVLPNEFKRKAMHRVFPHKQGDGFPAFYDRCTPAEVEEMARAAGFTIEGERRHYRSTYFGFLVPLYIAWRAASTVQYALDDNYCENFEMVLRKGE